MKVEVRWGQVDVDPPSLLNITHPRKEPLWVFPKGFEPKALSSWTGRSPLKVHDGAWFSPILGFSEAS